MRHRVLKAQSYWHPDTGTQATEAGELREDLHPEAIKVGLAEGWLEPDDDDGAPPREKAAARRAPERK